jgi:polysaccharide export outer membrane protein
MLNIVSISVKKRKDYMRTKILLVIVIWGLLASCGPKQLRVKEYELAANVPNPAKPPEEFYQIGPGDTIAIVLWKEPTLSGSVRVRPDGYVTLPLVNEVQVVGLTPIQVRTLLEDKYKEFIANPFVSVRVENITSAEILMLGQVTKPGAYPLNGNETVLHLLTRAGGLTPFATRDEIKVMRRESNRVTEYTVDYNAILAGYLKQDILLRPGDRIIVP